MALTLVFIIDSENRVNSFCICVHGPIVNVNIKASVRNCYFEANILRHESPSLCISGEAILYKFWYFPSQLTFPFGGNQNSFEWYKFWNFLSHVKILNFSKLTKQFFWTYDFGYMISCTRLRYTTFRFWFKTNWTSMFSSTTMLTNRNKLWIINCDNLVLVLT